MWHQFYVSCSILSVIRSIVSPTLDVNPTLFVIPCDLWGGYKFTVLWLLSLAKQLLIQISTIYDNISSQVGYNRR